MTILCSFMKRCVSILCWRIFVFNILHNILTNTQMTFRSCQMKRCRSTIISRIFISNLLHDILTNFQMVILSS